MQASVPFINTTFQIYICKYMQDSSKYKYYLLNLINSLLQIVNIPCLLAQVK
jgi:hypothetical protein